MRIAMTPRNWCEVECMQIDFPRSATEGVSVGASVALNGTCLTVTEIAASHLAFDAIAETLRRTNLGQLRQGSKVNFERSARVGDEIGGHNVSGHVHTTAKIVSASRSGEDVRLEFEMRDATWMKYVLKKGFIAVDGCSLTVGEVCTLLRMSARCTPTPGIAHGSQVFLRAGCVAAALSSNAQTSMPNARHDAMRNLWICVQVTDGSFSVYLIPETLRMTVLGDKQEGSFVNVEVEAQTQAIVDTVERVVANKLPQLLQQQAQAT